MPNKSEIPLQFRRAQSEGDLRAAMEVRREVFVIEQHVDEAEEYDGLDAECLQYVAVSAGRIVGTARVRFPSPDYAKIERMAVLKPFRRSGVGAGVLGCIEKELQARKTPETMLHAQVHALPFYLACGYVAEGEHFYEANIEHVKMTKKLGE